MEGGQIIRMHLKQYIKTHCILIYKDLAGLNIRNDQDNTGINIFDRPLHRQYVQERQKCYTTQRFWKMNIGNIWPKTLKSVARVYCLFACENDVVISSKLKKLKACEVNNDNIYFMPSEDFSSNIDNNRPLATWII